MKNRHELILSVAVEGFWDWDLTTDTAYLSPRYCELVGCSPDDTVFDSKFFRDIIHPDDQEHVFNVIENHLQSKSPHYIVEYRMTDKSGNFRWIESRGRIVEYDEQNKPARMAGIIVDISDRKYTEVSLETTEARFRALIENIPNVAIQGYSADGIVKFWNTANEKVYGYTAEEAIGKDIVELIIPPEMRPLVRQAIQHGAETGEMPPASELSLMHKDGSLVSVFSSHAVVEISGEEPELYCMDLDFTELKKVEEALRKSQEQILKLANEQSIILNCMPIGLCFVKDRKIQLANPAFDQLFGYEAGTTKGMSTSEFYAVSEIFYRVGNEAYEVIDRGETYTTEFVMKKRDGSLIYCNIKGQAVNPGKPEDGSIWMLQDFTERRRSEDNLKRKKSELDTAQEISHIGSWRVIYNDVGEYWYGSDELYRIYGYPLNMQLTMQTGIDRMHPDDLETVKAAWLAAMKGIGPNEWQHRIVVNDQIKWVNVRAQFKFDATGKLQEANGIVQDFTERKQVEELLRVSEDRFRTIVENTPNMVMIHVDGKFVYLNPAAVDTLGITTQEEYIGKPIIDIVHPDFRDLVRERVSKISNTNQVNLKTEEQLVRKDGKPLWVEITGIPTTYKGNKAVQVIAVNINERKLAEEELRSNRALLNNIINSTSDSIFVKDLQGQYLLFNAAAEKTVGKSAAEVFGKDDYYIFAQNEAKTIMELDHKVMEGGVVRTYEDVVTKYNGDEVTFLSTKGPLVDANGITIGLFGIARDISDRKHAEEALYKSEQRFLAIIEASPVPLAINDEFGNITLLNNAFVKSVGYTLSEIPTLLEWWPLAYPDPQYRQWVLNEWLNNMKVARQPNGSFTPIEINVVCKDSTTRTFLCSAAPLLGDYSGEIIVALYDITENKKFEKALQESNDLLVEIIEQSPISMAIANVDGAIEKINRRAIETFGYSPDEIPNMERWWTQAYPDESYRTEVISKWMGLVGKALADKSEIERQEYRVTCKDGTIKTVLIFGIPVYDKIFVIFDDITIKKKSEQQILNFNAELEMRVNERTEELERTNKELEEFCYALSHEFRAPIARLEGFGTILQEIAGEDDKEQIIRCADRIVAAGNRLRTVIDSLLVMNRAFRAEMYLQIINLSDLANHIIFELIEDVSQSSMNISIEPDVIATGDRYMLEICMRNLLSNAVKYSSKKDDALIEFGQSIISGEKVYFVRDNGVGFDMNFSKDIFKPFCRLHTESEFEGTGIGLATVHRIIEKHNGRIWIDAKPGEGATFFFTLGVSGGER